MDGGQQNEALPAPPAARQPVLTEESGSLSSENEATGFSRDSGPGCFPSSSLPEKDLPFFSFLLEMSLRDSQLFWWLCPVELRGQVLRGAEHGNGPCNKRVGRAPHPADRTRRLCWTGLAFAGGGTGWSYSLSNSCHRFVTQLRAGRSGPGNLAALLCTLHLFCFMRPREI